MPEAIAYERLLPCLLDRLTDDEPQARQEGRDRRVVGLRRYLEAVRRDLAWLLNSKARPRGDRIYDFPEVARSVLNYGIPDLCGATGSTVEPAEFERELRRAVQTFEPRLSPATLMVRADVDPQQTNSNALTFEIVGEVWAMPAPEAFFAKTEVDLETGDWRL